VLNIIITIAQVAGSIISGSLALLSDAIHNFSDVVALVIAYSTNRLAQRQATDTKTFGYKRAETLAALFNSAILVLIGIMLIFEAVERFFNPSVVLGYWVVALALLSVVLNWLSVVLIAKDAEHNTNVKAAYLHLMTDVMTSIAVLIGGVAIILFEVYWVDALITIIIAFYLIYASWGLLKSSTAVLMQFSPANIELAELNEQIVSFDGIENVHHIHLWQLNDYQINLEAHLCFVKDLPLSEVTTKIVAIEKEIQEKFGINHFNLQAEFGRLDCKKC
jgi:cobalt-zinc-cadmium efflux system protein